MHILKIISKYTITTNYTKNIYYIKLLSYYFYMEAKMQFKNRILFMLFRTLYCEEIYKHVPLFNEVYKKNLQKLGIYS